MFGALVGAATGLIGASGARSAANAQAQASKDQIELAREAWEYQKGALAPYRGDDIAVNALMYELGLGPAPTIGGSAPQINRVQTGQGNGQSFDDWAKDKYGSLDWHDDPGRWAWKERQARSEWEAGGGGQPQYAYEVGGQSFGTRDEAQQWAQANPTGGQTYQGYQKTPGYDFRLQEGMDAVQAGVGARHGLNSGATLEALAEHNQNFATNGYANHLNRLTGMTSMNQSAAAGQAGSAGQFATNGSNALANLGNAQAAGSIGVANAITGGINNGVGLWAYGQERGWG